MAARQAETREEACPLLCSAVDAWASSRPTTHPPLCPSHPSPLPHRKQIKGSMSTTNGQEELLELLRSVLGAPLQRWAHRSVGMQSGMPVCAVWTHWLCCVAPSKRMSHRAGQDHF